MVKINLSELKVYTDVGKTNQVTMNVRESIANDLYQKGQGVAFLSLALKIFNGKGEQEFNDDEYNILISYVRQMGRPMLIDALENIK